MNLSDTQIKNGWGIVRLGDVALIKGGKRLSKGEFVTDIKTSHPYIRVTDMADGSLNVSGVKYITDEQHEKIKKYIITDKDIYVSNAGTIGMVGKIPNFLSGANLTENALKVTEIDNSKTIQDYLLYFLMSRYGQEQIKASTGGSSQPKFALNKLQNLLISLPPLLIQEKVARTISAYDSLIENNEKRIKILESIAQKLYIEWFIKFKFPGHEKVKMVDSGHPDFGMIPDGWEVKNLKDCIKLEYGRALKEENREPGEILVCGSGGIVGTHNEKLVSGPGIVVGRKGNAGAVFWVSKDFYPIDTSFFVKTELSMEFIFYILLSQTFILGDAAVPGLNREQAYRNKVLLPKNELIKNFTDIVSPLRKLIDKIGDENKNLKKSRDLLIPQLISGKLLIKK